MDRRRVFITGLGLVSPHGSEPREVFERVWQGESRIARVRSGSDDFGDDVLLACVDFDPGDTIPKVQRVFMARAAQMAVVASHGALSRAGLLEDDRGPAEAGVYMGCGLGGSEVLQDAYERYFVRRSRRGRPTTVPLIMANGPTSHVSMRFGLRGPTHTYSVACASSTVSLGEAFRAVRDGYLDVAVAGGAEAMLNDASVAAWVRMGVLASEHPDGPEASCRPFDKERSGFALGEGASVLILETEDRVAARGIRPLAEVVGYGTASDAWNLTEPQATGQVAAMMGALRDAGVSTEMVGHINAHATATQTGDPVEVEAISQVFGDRARAITVAATKAVHGHLLGAAGALEASLTALALDEQRVPPTAHLHHPDPAFDLDFVPLEGRRTEGLEYALTNSFAFGGSNASVLLRRVQD